MEIHKKVLPEYFEKLLSCEKKFELRLADEELKDAHIGDVLVLDEYTSLDHATRQPTGRSVRKEITGVTQLTLEELNKMFSKEEIEKRGFLIFSLKD
jgi:hypothetical protein